MKNPKKTFFIGFILGLLFFGWWLRGFLYINWHFGLFSWSSWQFLFQEIASGWRFTTAGDWIFFASFILSVPLYFLTWYWVNKVHWGRMFKKMLRYIRKRFKRPSQPTQSPEKQPQPATPKAKIQKAPPISAQRPMAMPSFGPTMRTKPLDKAPNFQSMPSARPEMPLYKDNPSPMDKNLSPQMPIVGNSWEDLGPEFKQVADTPLSEIQLPHPQNVDEDIPNLLTKSGMTLLPDATLNGKKADLAAIAKDRLIWITYDDMEGDWLADEEAFNDEDPLWFSETDHRVSPVFTLGLQAQKLTQKLTEANLSLKVQPVLIERKGNLINAEDMLKTWNDLGVVVCRTATGGPVQLKTFEEFLNQTYSPAGDDQIQTVKKLLS